MEFIKAAYVYINFIFIFIILLGCASVPPSSLKPPPDQAEIKKIIDNISQNTTPVSTFISSGRVIFNNRVWGSESKTLIIGQREPLQFKVELTHSWGRPILHILIKEGKIEVLSFSENRLYKGTYSPLTLSKFIHVRPEIDQLWSILRGYPELKSSDSFILQDPDHLVLFDQNGKKQEKIGIDFETLKVSSISFPGSGLKISFSEYATEKGIPYAGKIRVDKEKVGQYLILTHEAMVFNREIPSKIFEIKMPPAFEIIDLDKIAPLTSNDGMIDHGH